MMKGRKQSVAPTSGLRVHVTRRKLEMALVAFLLGLVVLRAGLYFSGFSVVDVVGRVDGDGSSEGGRATAGRFRRATNKLTKGKPRERPSASSPLSSSSRGGGSTKSKAAASAKLDGSKQNLFSNAAEADLIDAEAHNQAAEEGEEVGAAKGGLDGNVLIMSAVEHGASLGGTRRKGGRGPFSPSPVAAQQVIMDFAEKGDFDAEEDEFNPADIIDEPEAENGAEGRRSKSKRRARRSDVGGREQPGEEAVHGEVIAGAPKTKRKTADSVHQQEVEELGKDLFANLARMEDSRRGLTPKQMPGQLPGQKSLSKMEHAVDLGDGKKQRDMIKGMKGRWRM